MGNVLLIHGYNGIPQIFHYFKQELKKMGYTIIIPNLPTQEGMRYHIWKEHFNEIKEKLNDELIVMAHSGGNPFIIQYANENKLNIKLYIGLAGFSNKFLTDGRNDLNVAVESLAPSELAINR